MIFRCKLTLKLTSQIYVCYFQVDVNHVDEIDEIFDAISYRKGAAVIRMLQSYLGAETFQVCDACSSVLPHVVLQFSNKYVLYILILQNTKRLSSNLKLNWPSRHVHTHVYMV